MPWGALIGAGATLAGDLFSSNASSKAAQQSLTGYNYLTGSKGVQGYVDNGNAASTAEGQLLGTSPITSQTQNGFNNYLNSTGYQFQLGQGTSAITGSAAARGLLNSGATGKALTQYGQNLASTTFNNYLGNLNNVAGQGLTASGQIGAAGTGGGASAAGYTQQGGNTLGNAAGTLGGYASNLFGSIGGGGMPTQPGPDPYIANV